MSSASPSTDARPSDQTGDLGAHQTNCGGIRSATPGNGYEPADGGKRQRGDNSSPTAGGGSNAARAAGKKPSSSGLGNGGLMLNGAVASSACNSVAARFKPVSRDAGCELRPMEPSQLAQLLTTQPESVLLIDVRPYTMFAFTHIKSALSICIPSTLLKRQTFGFQKIMDFVAPQDAETLSKVNECSRIVFYDQFTTQCAPDSPLRRTAAKFRDAGKGLAPKLYWLVGGLGVVAQEMPEFMEAGDSLLDPFPSGDGSSSSSSTEGGCTAPDTSGTTNNNNSNSNFSCDCKCSTHDTAEDTPRLTLSSVKATPRSPFSLLPVVTAIGGGLGSPINTPSRSQPPLDESSSIHAEGEVAERLCEFPRWLVNAVKLTESGQNVLAESFQSLQAAEMQRISPGSLSARESASSRLLSPRIRVMTPRSSPTTPYSDTSMLSSARSGSSTNTSPLDAKQVCSQPSQKHQHQHQHQHQHRSQTSSAAESASPRRTPSTSRAARSVKQDTAAYSPSPRRFLIVAGDDPRKNRYTNIAPFDHNRVVVRGSDYFNASYIRSSISPLQYIATQAPVPSSFGDFWWCVYEQKVPLIVMLTTLRTESGQIKSNKYWFNSNYDGLEVKLVDEYEEPFSAQSNDYYEPNHGITVRRIQLSLPDGHQHEVLHLQYQNWPDLGCPANPEEVLELVEMKKRIMSGSEPTSNVIVHCSAGCGRTGTFCTIDTVTDYLSRLSWTEAKEDQDDRVMNVVSDFREQRIAMVQNQRQLLLCYEAVMLWYLKRLDHAKS